MEEVVNGLIKFIENNLIDGFECEGEFDEQECTYQCNDEKYCKCQRIDGMRRELKHLKEQLNK